MLCVKTGDPSRLSSVTAYAMTRRLAPFVLAKGSLQRRA